MAYREFTAEERLAIQRELAKKLGPEYISERSQAGQKINYIEGRVAIGMCM
jgi:recombination DNA repair RAD52 pathway protein